ncbi:MAG TPA: hypothetical protein VOA80_07785 [Thermoanaerobaculia bacterium]|nr:hypothetical protein [Thermoanaerobaculia bacterium]
MSVKTQYREIVRNGTLSAGAVGLPGAFSFGLDVSAMTGIWIAMMIAVADRSAHRSDRVFAAKVVASVLAGVGAYVGGSKIAVTLLHLIPGAGTLAAMGVNSGLNALFTYKFGHAISNLFDKGTFDGGDATAAAATVLTLVACLPNLDELSDFLSMLKGA